MNHIVLCIVFCLEASGIKLPKKLRKLSTNVFNGESGLQDAQDLHGSANKNEYEVCNQGSETSRRFCMTTIGESTRQNVAKYKSDRKKCNWRPHLQVLSGLHDPENREDWTDLKPANNTISCKVHDGDETIHIFRTGPFITAGDNTCIGFGIDDVAPEYNNITVGLASYLQAPVDDSGDLIGRPPLHIHHVHFSDDQCNEIRLFKSGAHKKSEKYAMKTLLVRAAEVWGDTHGDKQCSAELGGVNCLLRRYPHGWGHPMNLKRSGCLVGDHVDVRPKGSPELSWFAENMLTIRTNVKQYLGLTPLGIGSFIYSSFTGRPLQESTYHLDVKNQSIVWGSVFFSYDGSAVQVQQHSHRSMLDDMWLVRGSALDLGLSQFNFLNHSNVDHQRNLSSLVKYKRLITQKIDELKKEGRAELLCTTSSQDSRFIWESINDTISERYVPVPCSGWRFRKWEHFVFIAFLKAQPSLKLSFEMKLRKRFTFPMHSTFYILALPDDDHPPPNMMTLDGITPEVTKAHYETLIGFSKQIQYVTPTRLEVHGDV